MAYELAVNLINCKESIVNKIKEEKGEKESKKIESDLKSLSLKMAILINSSMGKEVAVMGYNRTSNQKKLDPFIAGGIANGLFGAGAGVYTAINTANTNEQIESNKEHYKEKIQTTQEEVRKAEKEVKELSQKLYDQLNETIPNFKNFFEEELGKIARRKREEQEKKVQQDIKNFNIGIPCMFLGGIIMMSGFILGNAGWLIISFPLAIFLLWLGFKKLQE